MTKISPNFSFEEFVFSQTAARRGLSNTPPLAIGRILRDVTAPGMERVRELLGGRPILISSGYRSPALNRAVRGARNSAHLYGYAVDFICPGFRPPLTVCRALAEAGLRFDQLIHEYGRWVHVSFDPHARGQLLTIDRQGSRPGLHPIRS